MRDTKLTTILDAVTATGAGTSLEVSEADSVVFSLNTASNANCTVKFAGSISEDAPNFGAAQSVANAFDYLDVIDLNNGNSIDGDTGVVLTGTDDHRLFEVNVNGMKWVTAIVTARSAGAITVKARSFRVLN